MVEQWSFALAAALFAWLTMVTARDYRNHSDLALWFLLLSSCVIVTPCFIAVIEMLNGNVTMMLSACLAVLSFGLAWLCVALSYFTFFL